ncbi:hypothetical protein NDU88_004679 [Pleurodeles waltl]|uniref:Uncharacterized protein n=1 Tax=Pleurodeles waltl TaxID=8319 RepID=A0AAV7SJH1_PLEWA|nr:hypothetical protein NDU88_004679 [Pleurodeles waltl]
MAQIQSDTMEDLPAYELFPARFQIEGVSSTAGICKYLYCLRSMCTCSCAAQEGFQAPCASAHTWRSIALAHTYKAPVASNITSQEALVRGR